MTHPERPAVAGNTHLFSAGEPIEITRVDVPLRIEKRLRSIKNSKLKSASSLLTARRFQGFGLSGTASSLRSVTSSSEQ